MKTSAKLSLSVTDILDILILFSIPFSVDDSSVHFLLENAFAEIKLFSQTNVAAEVIRASCISVPKRPRVQKGMHIEQKWVQCGQIKS